MNSPFCLRIATRKSALALIQARMVAQLIQQHHQNIATTLVPCLSEGDQHTDVPLSEIGGKNLFVANIQQQLLDNQADCAVHSVKDMSVHAHPELSLAAILPRLDPRDVLLSTAASLLDLPADAVVGTASPRRHCLLQQCRADLNIRLLRGNIPTRIKKLDDGQYDAIILAAAGLIRLQKHHLIREYFPIHTFVPAIGQGAIAVECRHDEHRIKALIAPLNDPLSAQCIAAEQRINQVLNGDCHSALGVHAHTDGAHMTLHVFIGHPDNNRTIRLQRSAPHANSIALAESIAQHLLQQGAQDLLHPPTKQDVP